MNNKTLVAYFSASGCTKKVAEQINEIVKGDLYEIVPEVKYTHEDLIWTDKNSRSSVEMSDLSFRPKMINNIESIDSYDIIYIGYPIWWGVAPTIVNTFLESNDFSNKTLIPFCTSGSSGIGDTNEYIKKSVADTTIVLNGKRFSSYPNISDIESWINSLN